MNTNNSDTGKYSAGIKNLITSEAEILSILLYNYLLSWYKVAQKSEMHWMTPKWTWTLNSQKYFFNLIGNAPNDPKLNLNT